MGDPTPKTGELTAVAYKEVHLHQNQVMGIKLNFPYLLNRNYPRIKFQNDS